jgi:serine protease Do
MAGQARIRGKLTAQALAMGAAVWLAAAPALAQPRPAPAATPPAGAPVSFSELAQRLSPAVVNISTVQTVSTGESVPQFPPGSPLERYNDFFGRNNDGFTRQSSLGSGFVIDASGLIVTNNHVIEDADQIEVGFPDGLRLTATLVGRDPETDLAVLRVRHSAPLPVVRFGDSDAAAVGDWVIAIGNPFGFGGSVSAGIVSARNRDISAGRYDAFIQTDAAINQGNSGGPLFNLRGEVIGVNTAILSPSGGSVGVGFSVPSNLARQVVDQLTRFGETRRGWAGFNVQEVSPDIARSLGLPRPTGALLTRIEADSPASRAGLRVGDLITKMGGRDIADTRALARQIAATAIGTGVRVDFLRRGRPGNVNLVLAQAPGEAATTRPRDPVAQPAVSNALGIELAALTDDNRRRWRAPASLRGLLVQRVDPASPASGQLLVGDVIVELDNTLVTTPAETLARAETAGANGRPVFLQVWRDGAILFRGVRLRR